MTSHCAEASEVASGFATCPGPAPGRFLASRPDEIHATGLLSQFGYVNRQLNRMVRDLLAKSLLVESAKVVDYGCADRPYATFLPPNVEYMGADLPGNAKADVNIAPDGTIPIPSETVDLVLSTQVLEHVDDPAAYLAECSRILRPGGKLLLSTHGIMYYHPDPEDYWRWTSAGLQRVLQDHSFEVLDLRGLLGLVAASLQLIQDRTCWKVPRRLRRVYVGAMQFLIALSDRSDTDVARAANSLTIAILARKVG